MSSVPFEIMRPTLPSLQSLGLLPDIVLDNHECRSSSSIDDAMPWQNDFSRWHRTRQSSVSSTSSSCTAVSSRPPSPSELHALKDLQVSDALRPGEDPKTPTPNAFSLVLTTFEKANAFVVVPPPAQYVPNISAYSRSSHSSAHSAKRNIQRNRALLLVGPAVEYLRHPRVRIAKGARVHPYRIVPSTLRRPSGSMPLPSIPQ